MASRFCLRSIARTKNKCGGRCENFWLIRPSECFLRTARQFYPTRAKGCELCWTAIAECPGKGNDENLFPIQIPNFVFFVAFCKSFSDGVSPRHNCSFSAADSFFAHDLRAAVCSWRAGCRGEWLPIIENFAFGG